MGNLLSLKNLTVEFSQNKEISLAVNKVNLEVRHKEIVGLVGESGSGKTITTRAITKILPPNARITSGEVIFEGMDLLKIKAEELRSMRGEKISYIFQEPVMYLNPILTVGSQISEAVSEHIRQDKEKVDPERRTVELLRQVAMPSAEEVFYDYPHQLSGGMNQRVMIAQALASNPSLLIADEPTTSLDIDTEAEILELLSDLQKEVGFSCIFITHNLGLVKKLCQRIYVMYRGSIVEAGDLERIFTNPQHEHTKALVKAYLRLAA
ncbi:MAG: ABC transporter ATP-binding protein [Candidatus Omnitrophica bacterium]|nr:ABC transporter ATP-binding protein [Candidatus Omnitrophota bacterium]